MQGKEFRRACWDEHQKRRWLDELVHEEKAGEADAINNEGVVAQIEYLIGVATLEDSSDSLEFDGTYRDQFVAELREKFKDVPEVLEAINDCMPEPSKAGEGDAS